MMNNFNFTPLVNPASLPPVPASSVIDHLENGGASSLMANRIACIARDLGGFSLDDPPSFAPLTAATDHSPANTSDGSGHWSPSLSPFLSLSSPNVSPPQATGNSGFQADDLPMVRKVFGPPAANCSIDSPLFERFFAAATEQSPANTTSSGSGQSSPQSQSLFSSTNVSPLPAAPNSGNDGFHADDLPCVRINGRKVFGPLTTWSGPPPPIAAEVFVKRIPRNMNEQHLHALFRRFGPIYCIRLMVDFNDDNRGFGYVHYTSVAAADRALYVLQHRYVQPRVQLHLERSYDKCRLFVSHLPKYLRVNTVQSGLHETFPEASAVISYQANDGQSGNRGFAFMDFPTHDAAIRAKQQASTGRVRLFGQDAQILWANPERSIPSEKMNEVCTLFVRNVEMELSQSSLFAIIIKFAKPEEVRKVARNRNLAFIEMRTRASAERVMNGLQGYIGLKRAFEVKWSIPPSPLAASPPDHDATLRLLCVANEWLVPIYLFGRIFVDNMSQHVCVVLAAMDTSGDIVQHCALLMEMRVCCVDLQSRAAEVAVSLVRRSGRMPSVNYVVVVDKDAYCIVGCVTDLQTGVFQRAACFPGSPEVVIPLHCSELQTLAQCANHLLLVSRRQLQQRYGNELCMTFIGPYGYLTNLQVNCRIFGCINPAYRQKPSLEHGCDMGQLLLVACDARTGRNYSLGGQAETSTAYELHLETGDGDTKLRYERVPLEAVQAMVNGTGELQGVGENFAVFFGLAPDGAPTTGNQ